MAVVFGGDEAIDGLKEEYFRGVIAHGAIGASPLLFPYTSLNAITAQITIAFGIKGEDMTIAAGPVSFLRALVYACELLKESVVDFALVGGFSENAAFAMALQASHDAKANGAPELTADCVQPHDIDLYDEVLITSIEGSFALMQRLMEKHGAIKAVDKHGANVVFMRTK
jgi:3-oxoacyl-(acyl-carrier-protein) synthase